MKPPVIGIRRAEARDAEALHAVYSSPKAMAGTLQLPFPSMEMWLASDELSRFARLLIYSGPKPWLPVVRSAASNAWYAVPQWRLGIRRGCLPIGLSLAPSETRSLTVSKGVFWALLLKCRGLSNRHISSKVSPPAKNKSLASG